MWARDTARVAGWAASGLAALAWQLVAAPEPRGGARPRAEKRSEAKRREEKPSNPPPHPRLAHDARDRLAAPAGGGRAPPLFSGARESGLQQRPPPAPTARPVRVGARGVGVGVGGRPASEGGGGGPGVPGDVVRDAAAVLHARGQRWGREDELRGVAGRAVRQQRPPDPRRLHRPRALAQRFLRTGRSSR